MSTESRFAGMRPELVKAVLSIEQELTRWCSVHWPGHKARMSEGYRTVARQQELWRQGRDARGNVIDRSKVVTFKNGTTNKSNHQSGRAADIVGVTPDGRLTWDCPEEFWKYLQHLAHVHGLVSGSDWKMMDRPHVEMK